MLVMISILDGIHYFEFTKILQGLSNLFHKVMIFLSFLVLKVCQKESFYQYVNACSLQTDSFIWKPVPDLR